MSITGKVDFADVFKGLDGLVKIKTSLARSMAVAGGQVLRDEAKARAPLGTEEGGSLYPGLLRSAIYLAYSDNRSTASQAVYSVTWNATKAPHGHLVEFGHWRIYKLAKVPGGYGGGWYSTKTKLATPEWVPAHPFLRPAMDSTGQRAVEAMKQRGRERLPELLRDQYSESADFE